MSDDEMETWLAADDPDDIAGAMAFAQEPGEPGPRSKWPIIIGAAIGLLIAGLLLRCCWPW